MWQEVWRQTTRGINSTKPIIHKPVGLELSGLAITKKKKVKPRVRKRTISSGYFRWENSPQETSLGAAFKWPSSGIDDRKVGSPRLPRLGDQDPVPAGEIASVHGSVQKKENRMDL